MSPPPDRSSLFAARSGLFEIYRRQARLVWLQAEGTSMRPTIPPGSWIQVQFGERARRRGEIVLFADRGAIIAHRVIAFDRGRVQVKGDASRDFDAPVAMGEVLGVVRARRRQRSSRARRLGCRGASARLLAALSELEGRVAGRLDGCRR